MSTKIHLELELPEGLIDAAFEEELRRGFREEAALRLFKEGKVSSGFAARLMGVSRLEFLTLLQQRGIPLLEYTLEDYRDDLAAIHKFEATAPPDATDR